MQLPLKLLLVIENVFDVSDDRVRYTRKLLMVSAEQNFLCFKLVPLLHDIDTTVVLGQQEVFDREEDNDEKEKDFGLRFRVHIPSINHIG